MAYVEMGSFGAVEPSAVKAVQTKMIAQGFLSGKADGVVGPATFAAAVKWVNASVDMVNKYIPIVAKSGVAKVSDILAARLKSIKEALPAIVKSGNPTTLAGIQKQLAAMYATAANDVGHKVPVSTTAFLAIDLSVLGSSSKAAAAKVSTAAEVSVPAAEPVPLNTSGSFPVLPVVGGLIALVAVGVALSGSPKKR